MGCKESDMTERPSTAEHRMEATVDVDYIDNNSKVKLVPGLHTNNQPCYVPGQNSAHFNVHLNMTF